MTSHSKRIGERVRRARLAAGLKQEALAYKAGVAVATLSRLENGRTAHPREDEFERIARALGTTTDALMGIEQEPDSPEDSPATYADLVRRAQKATGNRKVALGFARAITDWNKLGEAERQLLEAALAILPDAPEGPEDISKTEF